MESDLDFAENNVINKYISLNDFVVNFTPEVEKFFIERIGESEYRNICKQSCQAPPYV